MGLESNTLELIIGVTLAVPALYATWKIIDNFDWLCDLLLNIKKKKP